MTKVGNQLSGLDQLEAQTGGGLTVVVGDPVRYHYTSNLPDLTITAPNLHRKIKVSIGSSIASHQQLLHALYKRTVQ